MREILGIACLLCGAGMLCCRMEGLAAREDYRPPAAWVRTADGWERADRWQRSPATPARLHPLVVAAGQGLLSMWALAAAEPWSLQRRRGR